MFCLTEDTDEEWARAALADLDAILIDHAHCELKAATNAMSLVARYPDQMELALALTALAEEELDHLRQVLDRMAARGLVLGPPPVDKYAAALRQAAATLPGRHDERFVFVDRLLIGALIEARSCERFKVLATALEREGREPELQAFYHELFVCEARHYRTYSDLAKMVLRNVPAKGGAGRSDVDAVIDERLRALAVLEGCIVQELATAMAPGGPPNPGDGAAPGGEPNRAGEKGAAPRASVHG